MPKHAIASAAKFFSAVAIAGTMGLAGSAVAQDSGSTPAANDDVVGHPAHIHAGTCDTLGDVVFPLNNIVTMEAVSPEDAAMATPPVGEVIAAGQPSTVDASLEDILAAEHAINVHLNPENMDVYIACGDITGSIESGVLLVDLEELNSSGFMGQARLMDNGDGTTTVYMDLIPANEATPAT